MKKNKNRFFFSFILIFAFLLYACSGSDPKDLRNYIKNLKKTASKKELTSTLENIVVPVPVYYQASKLRTPFESTESLTSVKDGVIRNPLEAYPLSMLRFVGTASEGGRTVAFIVTPNNMIYQVKEGDTIGEHGDRIANIEADRINVMVSETQNGKLIQHYITLQLRNDMDLQ